MYLLALVRLLRRDAVQQAAKVKIYTEQLQQQKLTLDNTGCMINHCGQGALDSKSWRKENGGGGCASLRQDWDIYKKKKVAMFQFKTILVELLAVIKLKSSVS